MATNLRSPTTDPVALAPVRANAGLEAAYRGDLDRLIAEMVNSIDYWLTATWRADTPATVAQDSRTPIFRIGPGSTDWRYGCTTTPIVAQDASGAAQLRAALLRLANRWQSKFDKAADDIGKRFAAKTLKITDVALMDRLSKAGFAVQFKMTPIMRDAYSAVIGEQVGLIKSIASQHLTQVQTVVMQGVQTGRDLGYIHNQLRERYGVTKRRAALIARDQSNKATSTLTRTRQLALGIEKGIWRHSGAGKEPRPEHVAADGKEFDLQKGMYLEGVWTWPGHEINCRCTWTPVIAGWED